MAQASAPIGLKTDQTSGGILADSTMEEGFCVFDKVYALEIYPLPLTLLNSSSCHLGRICGSIWGESFGPCDPVPCVFGPGLEGGG
jgi:hypothetical protein